MAPRPGGPGGYGGGPRGGGPHGGYGPGGFGPGGYGPRGFGPGGPGGYGPYHRRHINVVPPTYTGGSTGGQSSEYVDENGKPISEAAYLRKKFGTLKGTRMTLQLSTNGAMKEEMFKARCATADDLLKDKRITAKEAIKRKMDAVKIFYGYLKEIGYWTAEEYDSAMSDYALSIGTTYTPVSSSTTRRTR